MAPPEHISELGLRNSSATILPAGAILLSSRAPIGLVAIAGRPMATNQGFKSLVPGPSLDSRFLYYAIKRIVPIIEARGNGATFKEVSKSVMEEIELSYPPTISEQRRIGMILDKAHSICRKRRQAFAEIDALLRSAYQNLVGTQHPNFSKWKTLKFEELAASRPGAMRTGPFGSDLRHSEFVDEGVAVLGIDNAVTNKFAWGERRYITPEKYEGLRRYRAFPGDVIVTIMGTTGRSAVVPDDIAEAITTKHLATITVNQELALPEFVAFAIHSDPRIVGQIKRANKGAIMDGLNLGIIKKLEIVLPPLDAQRRFGEVYRRLNAHKLRLDAPASNGDHLFNALCQRAFRGEL
jgi:type I restriction enzyme S subunit